MLTSWHLAFGVHCSQNKGIHPEKTNQTLPDRGHTRQDMSDGFSSGWYMPRELKESGHPGPLNTKDSDVAALGQGESFGDFGSIGNILDLLLKAAAAGWP